MVAGGGEGDPVAAAPLLDQLPGETHVLQRGRRPAFRQDLFRRDALPAHIAGHGLRLGLRLIRALSPAGDQHGALARGGLLPAHEGDRAVDAGADQRVQRAVRPDAAAEHDHVVAVVGRLMLPGHQRVDHGGGEHALEVHKQSRVNVQQDVSQREGQQRIAHPDPEGRAAGNHQRHRDAEHVRGAEALVAHQHQIAEGEGQRKHAESDRRPAHEGLRGDDGADEQRPDRPGVFPAQEGQDGADLKEAREQQEDREAQLPRRAVGEVRPSPFSVRGREKDARGGEQEQGQAGGEIAPARKVPGDAVGQDAEGQRAQLHADHRVIKAVLADALPADRRLCRSAAQRLEVNGKLAAVVRNAAFRLPHDPLRLEAEGHPRRLRGDLKIQRQPAAAEAQAQREGADAKRQRREQANPRPAHLIAAGSKAAPRAGSGPGR